MTQRFVQLCCPKLIRIAKKVDTKTGQHRAKHQIGKRHTDDNEQAFLSKFLVQREENDYGQLCDDNKCSFHLIKAARPQPYMLWEEGPTLNGTFCPG